MAHYPDHTRTAQTLLDQQSTINQLTAKLKRAAATIQRVEQACHDLPYEHARRILTALTDQPPTQTATEAQQGEAVEDAATKTPQAAPWPVKASTRRYAEELRRAPSTGVVTDGHTGWECDAGASLLVSARTPGPGALGTHHGTIYACAAHQGAAVKRLTDAGYQADPQPAPPGHRWNPWPCGHVTAHGTHALNALTTAAARQDQEQ
ncbi:hypothetical protein [Streptomyces sp. NPDC006997]|uniref:hypothetical protein n=1 Tax=Streptomyces sp. NPDC006997 TaxID=3155356 RepID=UPI0034093AB7